MLMKEDGRVDQAKLFESDPEAWAEWETKQLNDLQKKFDAEPDFDKRDELGEQIAAVQQRIDAITKAAESAEARQKVREARDAEPQTPDKVVAQYLSAYKGSRDKDDFLRETGYSDEDMKGFVGGFVKGGSIGVQRLAEIIKESDDTGLSSNLDDMDIRDAILNVLSQVRSWNDVKNFIKNNRAAMAEEQARQEQEAIEAAKPTFIDVVKTLYEKGKAVANSLFQRSYFDVAETPAFLKEKGLTGDKFTNRYGTISRHIGKDTEHNLTEQVWEALPDALQHPFAVTRYGKDGFRVYTEIQVGDGFVVAGVDVKNAGRDLEVNSISTVFAKEGKIGANEDVIYESETITPQQKSLLERPNSSQYPTAEAIVEQNESVSDYKDNQNSETATDISPKQQEIAEAEAEVDTEPTEAQKEAGNYKKGHIKLDGYDISIEQPKGSVRSGTDAQGREWSQVMNNTYGYIRGTEGVDGDHIDVFLSDNPEEGNVYVVDQVNPDGTFDEHKVMYGFPDMDFLRRVADDLTTKYTNLGRYVNIEDGVEGGDNGDYSDRIVRIFAKPGRDYDSYEETFFHENLHCYLERLGVDARRLFPFIPKEAMDIIDNYYNAIGYDTAEATGLGRDEEGGGRDVQPSEGRAAGNLRMVQAESTEEEPGRDTDREIARAVASPRQQRPHLNTAHSQPVS